MYTQKILDVNSSPYVGIQFGLFSDNVASIVETSLNKNYFTGEDLQRAVKRNNMSYHLTLFNVMECNANPELLNQTNVEIDDLVFLGIGSISKGENTTYFIVAESDTLSKMREDAGLKEKDLHVTIAFTNKDSFHDRKNKCNIYAF